MVQGEYKEAKVVRGFAKEIYTNSQSGINSHILPQNYGWMLNFLAAQLRQAHKVLCAWLASLRKLA